MQRIERLKSRSFYDALSNRGQGGNENGSCYLERNHNVMNAAAQDLNLPFC